MHWSLVKEIASITTLGPRRRLPSASLIDLGGLERAQAIVEFALVLPVLTLLLLLGVDFARVMHDRLILFDAARAGAQIAAASPAPPFPRVAAAVVAETSDLPIQGDAAHIQVRYPADGTVVVRVEYDFQAMTPLIALTWGGGPLAVSAAATWPLVSTGAVPTPLPTPSPRPSATPTAAPAPTAAPRPTASATASATAAPTPPPVDGCSLTRHQSLAQGQGYVVTVRFPPNAGSFQISYRAPSTRGAVQIYLYAGAPSFADRTGLVALPPPLGSIASSSARGDAAHLVGVVDRKVSLYTLYFYARADATGPGKSVEQRVTCPGRGEGN